MPYLGETTLAGVLAGGREVPERQALGWLCGLAEGLGHAHERGLLHLDVKPANVLITDDGVAMLLDFNLSARCGVSEEVAGGTLAYMSPEQIRRLQGEEVEVGPASDVYALGLLGWRLLTGTHLTPLPGGWTDSGGPSAEQLSVLLFARRRGPRADDARLRKLAPSMRAILGRCLAAEPGLRYRNGGELAEDLRRHLDDLPLRHAGTASLLERLGKWTRRHPRWSAAAMCAVVGGVVIGLVGSAYVARSRDLAASRAAYARSQSELAVGEVSAARPTLLAATRVAPHDAALWAWLGHAYYGSGNAERALAAWQTAAALVPNDPTLLHLMGVAQIALGDYEGAEASLTGCLAADGDYAAAWCSRAPSPGRILATFCG